MRINANAVIKRGEKIQKRANQFQVPLGKGAKAIGGGLVPVGNAGFYATPDEPADPRDCVRYPDSIWCGRNPFSKKPVDIGWQIVANECGIRGTVKPTLGFVKLPPISVAYVRPECRGELAEPPPSEPVEVSEGLDRPRPPTGFDRAGDKNKTAYCGVGSWRYSENLLRKDGQDYILVVSEISSGRQIVESNAFYTDSDEIRRRSSIQCVRTFSTSHQYSTGGEAGEMLYFNSNDSNTRYVRMGSDGRISFEGSISTTNKTGDTSVPGPYEIILGSSPYAGGGFGIDNDSKIWLGKISAVEAYYKAKSYANEIGFLTFHCFDIYVPNAVPSPNRKRRGSPYLTKRKCDCMGCCEPRTDPGLDKVIRLLEKIIKLLGEYPSNFEVWDSDETKQGIQKTQKSVTSTREAVRLSVDLANRLSRIIGIDLLPFELPKTTVDKDNEGILGDIWDAITPDQTEKITSIMDFFKWNVLNDSANWGAWQRVIEEQGDVPRNSDGTPQTNEDGTPKPAQKQKIVLPDMATTLEESIRLNIRTQKTLGLMFDFIVKLQLECAGIKTVAAQTLLTSEDIQEYMDYPTRRKSSLVPTQITVPNPNGSAEERNDLHKFEQPSKAVVAYDDWTGELSLQQQLNQILMVVRQTKGQQTGQ